MIALDTNILVYAFRPEAARHERANQVLKELLESGRPWCLPWSVAHEFLAVVTQPRIWRTPASPSQGLAALRAWRAAPGARLLAEGPAYAELLEGLLDGDDVRGSRVFDARIVATCLLHGVRELWSADRDLSRFPQLRTRNPLVV
jgi:uncharacterized protein